MTKQVATFLLSGLMFFSASYASLPNDTLIDRSYSIDEVKVESRRTTQTITSPKPVQNVSKERIEQLGLYNVSDAVKLFAGTEVKDYGGIGGLKTVSIRNLGAFHTAVSYDGITISNTQAGQIDIGRFTTDNISNISLAIGENDEQMQSARHYAAAGLLIINTEKPSFDNRNWHLTANVRGGSFGLLSPTIRFAHKISESTSFDINTSLTRADGNYPYTLKNISETIKAKRKNTDVFSTQAEANIYHVISRNSDINAKVYYYSSERGLPGGVILYNDDSKERLWDDNIFAQSMYRLKINNKWKLQARAKYTFAKSHYEDTNVKYPDGRQTDINIQNEYYLSATLGWNPTDILSFAIAQDMFINKLNNNLPTQPDPDRLSSLTAVSGKLKTNRWSINANIVATYVKECVDKGETPADRKRLSPSVAASFRLLKDKSLFARAMVKSTFRVPTFTDMYYLRMGNKNLKPENATEYNMGLTWHVKPFRGLSVEFTADAYYNNVSDKIVAVPTTYVWKMTNFGEVHIKGVDLTLAAGWRINSNYSLNINGAYTLQCAVDKTDKSKESYNNQIPYTPKHYSHLSALLNMPLLNVGYKMSFYGERYTMAQNTDEYRLSPYAEHSITLTKEMDISNIRVKLAASLNNIFNKQYEVIQYYPMPGRNWMVSATIDI